MTLSYYIDGPSKGSIQNSDFRPTILSTGEIYHKHTFAKRTDFGILFTDIASINPELRELQIQENIPFFIRPERNLLLKFVPIGGEIE